MLGWACQGRAERALVERFFEASRLRDKTALAGFATVVFEPLQQGIVTTFEVVRIGPEESSAAGAAALVAKEVTIVAPVRQPDGRTVEKRLVLTLQRPSSGAAGNWTITGVVVSNPSF